MNPEMLQRVGNVGRDALSRWDNEGGAVSQQGISPCLCMLIVSTDPLVSLSLASALHSIGHRVCAVALTNDQALKAAAICQPDLIIADAYLDDDERLMAVAPVMRALFVPHMFNNGVPQPRPRLRPGAVVLRRPFRATDLLRAIRQAFEVTV